MLRAAKNYSLPNHDNQERVALSNSWKRPTGTAATRESKDGSEEFPDVAIVVLREK